MGGEVLTFVIVMISISLLLPLALLALVGWATFSEMRHMEHVQREEAPRPTRWGR